jgi:hypothetical protein
MFNEIDMSSILDGTTKNTWHICANFDLTKCYNSKKFSTFTSIVDKIENDLNQIDSILFDIIDSQ